MQGFITQGIFLLSCETFNSIERRILLTFYPLPPSTETAWEQDFAFIFINNNYILYINFDTW
jgi:hypothetical protein